MTDYTLVKLLRRCLALCLLAAFLLRPKILSAEPVAVRYREGSIHGFLALRTPEGKVLASGDLIQVIHAHRAVSRLVFRFKDGSIDDETAIFSQQGTFRLISDHHIQKGPAFAKPIDVLIDASSGQVTVRYNDKDKEKVETSHLDLSPDLANGIILNILKNIAPGAGETTLSYVAATPKPRLVKLVITSQGEDAFSVVGSRHKAIRFNVKVQLGGLAGIIAPIIGKQPEDVNVWVVGGEAPAFVKLEGPLYLGGPIWRLEMARPAWPNEASHK